MSDLSIPIHCGDCLDYLKTIATGSVDAIIADPPYGMDYQSSWTTGEKRKRKIPNDKRPYIWWLPEAYRVLKDGGALYSFTDWRNSEAFRFAIHIAGFAVKSQAIWDRNAHGMGDLSGSIAPQHDVIWFATKGSFKFPGKRPKSIMRVNRVPASELIHPNQKPVELLEQLIVSITRPGEVVLDPFMGVGTTGIAARNTDRRYIGVELDADYFAIATKRLDSITTFVPDLSSSGSS